MDRVQKAVQTNAGVPGASIHVYLNNPFSPLCHPPGRSELQRIVSKKQYKQMLESQVLGAAVTPTAGTKRSASGEPRIYSIYVKSLRQKKQMLEIQVHEVAVPTTAGSKWSASGEPRTYLMLNLGSSTSRCGRPRSLKRL